MTKKKITIYCTIACMFAILFSLYIWSVLESASAIHMQRLEENMRVTEQQIQKNLEALSKDLALELVDYALGELDTLEALTARLHERADKKGEYYIIDEAGVLYSGTNQLNYVKIESGALKAARSLGYSAVSIPNAKGTGVGIGIIIPLSGSTPRYFAKVIPLEQFFDVAVKDLPIATDALLLFDEWGGVLSVYDEHADPARHQLLQQMAVDYSNSGEAMSHRKLPSSGSYSIYVSMGQPRGWFIGAGVSYEEEGSALFGLSASSLLILLALVFLLGTVVCLDVFNDREKKRELSRANEVDPLTGLTSGPAMAAVFQKAFDKHASKGLSLVCMDVISFSRVNTMFGHMVGDSVLRAIGQVIEQHTLCGARVNADCFAFFTRVGDDGLTTFEQWVNDAISTHLGPEYLQMISLRFGVYHIQEARPLFHDVYERALLALKDAKKQTLQNCVSYDEDLRKSTELQKNIEVNMMHALSKEEFLVYIQPQFDMPGERCTRGETLIRWNSEFMGFMPPDQFIPVFERNGFIVETDFFMLTCALELQQARINEGKPPFTLAVNQSKVTIAFPNYFERLKATVASYQVPLSSIELEITESTLENAWETIVPLIHSIKKLGFSVAMDDFGSGFSSLNTLRILPIDVLKIDKAFLQESDSSARCRTIIKNVIHMAKELSMHVVCEGVETQEQLDFLKSVGCDIVQGYFYSRPIPQADFVEKYLQD